MPNAVIFICCLLLLVFAVFPGHGPVASPTSSEQPAGVTTAFQLSRARLNCRIIHPTGGSYDYDVFADQKILVYQPDKPLFPGSKGFTTKSAAKKVAVPVNERIKKGQFPPSWDKTN